MTGVQTCALPISSGISSFVIFLLFFVEELSPGLTSLVSPLGDPSDGKVELEIILLSMESSLSLISSTDRMSYLLQPSAHPDWCLEPRLFPTSQPGVHNLWTRPLHCPKTFLEWTWTNHGPCSCLLFPFWCFYPHPRRLLLLLQMVFMSMVSGSFVLALSAIPVFIKLRSCFLLPACFRSCLRIGHWHVAAKFLCSSSLPSFS